MISKRRRTSSRKGKDSGVSEIIGDILILAMTVTLFSTVFFFVSAFPTPNAQTFANFNASLSTPTPTPFGTSTVLLNITHEGGQQLTSSLTSVVIQINQSTSVYALSSSGYSFVNSSSATPWSNSKWTTGETWIMNLTGVTSSSVVGVSIIDKANNYIVWSTVLNGKPSHIHPVIQNAWATPNPVKPGTLVTINASIYNGGSSSITLTANVSFLNNSASIKSSPSKMTMYLNSATGFYNTSDFTVNKSTPLGMYPVTVTVSSGSGQHPSYSNYTFMVSVENTGPTIITASINPNPSTPGSSFNITAYVLDSNPQAAIHNVTVKQLSGSNIATFSGSTMKLSQYQGVYILEGNVSSTANYTQFESFELTATDSSGNNATYVVELFLNYFLNPNQYFPSKYLGPTSLSFSNFKWNPAGSQIYYPGSSVNTANLPSPGIYFNLNLQNHNLTSDLYLDDLSNIYLFFGATQGFKQLMSFIVYNSTTGNTLWNISSTSTPSNPAYNTIAPPAGYPSLSWSGSGPAGPWQSSFLLLPAAVGGVVVSSGITFGALSTGATNSPVPATGGGPFNPTVGSGKDITVPSLSADFLELFGYFLPAGTQPWSTNPIYGTSFGQTLPFTAIYWY